MVLETAQVYSNILGHIPDQAGQDYYAKALAAGKITPGQLALSVLNGAQGGDAATLDSKLKVATDFTSQLSADPTKAAAYSSGASLADIQKVLGTINANVKASDLANIFNQVMHKVDPTSAHDYSGDFTNGKGGNHNDGNHNDGNHNDGSHDGAPVMPTTPIVPTTTLVPTTPTAPTAPTAPAHFSMMGTAAEITTTGVWSSIDHHGMLMG